MFTKYQQAIRRASTRPESSAPAARRRLAIQGMAASLVLFGAPVQAEQEPPLGQITPDLRVTGELRGRIEAYDFFQPALNPGKGVTANRNDYAFGALRARLGVAWTTPFVDAFAQGQYTGLYDLPTQAFAGLPVGPLGLGGAYYKENDAVNPGMVFLKQGYLNIKGAAVGLPGGSLKGGRFEIMDGLEYKTGDAKFDALKTTRVSQRLIGPFDFTHITRSFDGFSLAYDDPSANVTLAAVHPTQGGFNINAMDEISHIDLAYGALTSKKGALLPDTEARLFYVYYGDDRNVSVVDNRAPALRPNLSKSRLSLHTIGTHVLTVQKLGPGTLDAMVWAAYQFGDWTNLHQDAYAATLEGGYQWTEVPLKPWIRAGYFHGSGDSNANDKRHETFFEIIPTVRLYAKFPYFNQMNMQDAFAQFNLAPTANTKLGIDFHHLFLASSNDLFYGGSGATSRTGSFGYFGRSSGGRGSVGELVDVSFTHTLNRHLSWSVYYAHAFGSGVTAASYQERNDADFGYAEFTASF